MLSSPLLESLNMSSLIAHDAPLLSPGPAEPVWDHPGLAHIAYPPSPPASDRTDSPVPTTRMLRMRMSPDTLSDADSQPCFPTHQVFEHAAHDMSPLPPTVALPSSVHSDDGYDGSSKRSASPQPSMSKKARAAGERVHSKDFIPPDVSGLSKREARLVKNRAAAFLSRQRKREEFEQMESRVADLERENARLQALAQSSTSSAFGNDHSLLSEVESLRMKLAAAEAREQRLNSELRSSHPAGPTVKIEPSDEPSLSFSTPSRSTPSVPPHKSGASFGLMVLLCALPSFLSMPSHTSTPSTFSLPSANSASFDLSSFSHQDFDWSRLGRSSSLSDGHSRSRPSMNSRKLEFSDAEAALGMSGLDVSFDASPVDNGKIRVKIHPSSTASSQSSSSMLMQPSSMPKVEEQTTNLNMWNSAQSFEHSYNFQPVSSSSDPFLADFGMTHSASYGPGSLSNAVDYGYTSDMNYGLGSEYSIPDGSGTKRRVRIALKKMPASDGEGGEWEVELC